MDDRPDVFDADAHVIEPQELYFEYLDPGFADRVAPDEGLGDRHGRLFPLLDGRPTFGGWDWMRETLRTDRGHTILVERFGDIAERGFSPAATLDALDAQGVRRAALFPSFSLHVPFTDHATPDLAAALARAYNRWLVEHCAEGDGRLVPVFVAPLHDPEAAEKELARLAADHDARGVMVRPNPVQGRPVTHADHDGFFAAAAEADVAVLLHEGRGGVHPFAGDERFDTWYAAHTVSHPVEMMLALVGFVVDGVFDRHPTLRVGVLESGTGWLPWWLHRLDEHHELFGPGERPDLALRPSEYFARHCTIGSDTDDPFVRATLEAVGSDHVVWSSDFPHLEAVYPDGVDQFLARSGLGADDAAAVLWETPRRLYGYAD